MADDALLATAVDRGRGGPPQEMAVAMHAFEFDDMRLPRDDRQLLTTDPRISPLFELLDDHAGLQRAITQKPLK